MSKEVKKSAPKNAPQKKESASKTASESEEKIVPAFGIVGQYIKDVSFECPLPSFLVKKGGKPRFSLEIGVQISTLTGEDGVHEVEVILRGKSTDEETQNAYYVGEVVAAGVFQVKGIEKQHVSPLLAIEGAAIIYPYARQVFMNGVLNTGFSAPVLGPVDFRSIYEQSQNQKVQPDTSAA